MTQEEALRRIERVADEKLSELDLSGLQLEEVPLKVCPPKILTVHPLGASATFIRL